ncbi:MAG: hypothetical protein U0Q55_13385 [Vicinamibacterales bacterium]
MLVWATEFPIASKNGCGDVLGVAKGTLATSPHSKWDIDSFGDDPSGELKRIELAGQTVTVGRVDADGESVAGLQHQWVENNEREWTTEIVGYEHQGKVLVSVRLDCNLLRPGLYLPTPKKPYVVRRILEDLGGGNDAGWTVADTPHRLQESQVDEAATIVKGTSGGRLPVVYVSVDRFRQPFVNVDALAQWLGGLAHVVVEPSRYFSFTLARNAGYMNAYGGAVSIYWPSGTAAQVRYLPTQFGSPEAMQREIAERVRSALTHIRPASKCTFAFLQELVSRARVERLKADGSKSVEDFVAAFDSEIKAKDERLEALERELSRMRAERRRHETSGEAEGAVLARGQEREFYPGEFSDAVIYTLAHGRSGLLPAGRRAHLIDDILKANKSTVMEAELESEIKDAFSDSGDLGSGQRRVLEDLGFTIEGAGKHWKAVYQGDERYTFVISKTSSDHRAGKNLASTIVKTLLK